MAWAALGLLMAVSAGLIWIWSPHQTLLGDEWGYAFRTSALPALDFMFEPPPGKHLTAIPLLLYKGAFEQFGIGSYVPYRLAHIVLLLLCAGLFYALARRRVGDTLAVLPTAILLFLGTSWEVVATPLRIPSLIAIASGLGMLLALERRDRAGDLGAFVLLCVGLASHSTALAFAAAAAVLVLSRPSPARWRSAWIFAAPLLAYAIWWVLEFSPDRSESLASTIAGLPVYLVKSLMATLGTTTGFGRYSSYLGLDISAGVEAVLVVASAALLAAILYAWLRRGRRIPPFVVAMAVALVVFWVLTGFAPGPERSPWTPRYMYPDAVLFLLMLCGIGEEFELPSGLTAPVAVTMACVLGVSLAGNVYALRSQEHALDIASDNERAALTGLGLAGSGISPQLSLRTVLAGRFDLYQTVAMLPYSALQRVLADYGSPAYTTAELASRPQPVRVTADYVSLRAAGSELRPVRALPPPRGSAPSHLAASGGSWASLRPGCVALQPSGGVATGILSPAGQLALAADPGPQVSLRAGRFSDGAAVPVGSLRGGGKALLELPDGGSVAPDWRVAISARQRVLACDV